MEPNTPLHVVQLTAENVKKLRVVRIAPTGALVEVTGPNGSGKSSVLDAIYWALAGTKNIESQPVRAGQESARIRLDLGEIVVTRRFTAGGGTSLIVEAADGSQYRSPQTMLDGMLGSLSFDPLAFSRLAPRAQLEELRKLVPVDVDVDAIDFENRRDFEVRTNVNRRVKDLQARVDAIVVPQDTPREATPMAELQARYEAAVSQIESVGREEMRRRQREEEMIAMETTVGQIDRDIQMLQERRAVAAAMLHRLREESAAEEPLPAREDLAPHRQRIAEAQAVNERVAARRRRDELAGELAAAEGEAATLTKRIDDRTTEKRDAIARAKMPVPGLGFGDGEVAYNGLPFAQASSAEQLRVSVALAMAANPTIRIIRIKDGSLLDERNLALIAEMAQERGYQVWVERVDTTGKIGVVMEDGAVAGMES